MNQPQQPKQPLTLYAEAEIRYKSGRVLKLEHVVFQAQVTPNGMHFLFEKTIGDHAATFVNFDEVEHIQMIPSKLTT